ncbi:MAG: NusG domain II-containing protein [Clostridia bacterium]|nr:NusG domain II-containing protein [Clostridia bacterium]
MSGNKNAPKGIKRDIILIMALLLAGGLIALCVRLFSGGGQKVEVRVDGRVTAAYSLNEERTVTVSGVGGSNVLSIKNGEACIIDADCPDGLCMKTGAIKYTGQSIICLPHRVVVEITAGAAEHSGTDADVYVK